MDVLDNYKKAWDNQPEETDKVSQIDIYKMAHARSSSIVKWIFIIGIVEFVVLNSMYFFVDNTKSIEEYEKIGILPFYNISMVISLVVVIYFLIQFYLNYKSISVVDSTKVLMHKILKTRKTVRNYVIFNLVFVAFSIAIIVSAKINFKIETITTVQIWKTIGVSFVITGIFLGLMYGVYQLIYGILLRKLNRNYKELAKLAELN
ncbi:hypothetical protein LPB136_01590 [Tenacibaculum todarodis]|uniref:Beta-carotene 15,15'-monooxygenase n=1 Tax=Tenacibaculum todarodis TaxID=1850252 RepID=A0A1L3JG70_9FLAO|nr:hypothetical protein [Tenacibaculum todarodis]APG64135.1 hypothetical protein LPB136_01590 [Tenacibaculum todarodis]